MAHPIKLAETPAWLPEATNRTGPSPELELVEAEPFSPARRYALEGVERGAVQKPEELETLLELLQGSPPRTVVEIGTDQGGSLYSYCRVAAPDATIVSIDKPYGNFASAVQERLPEQVHEYPGREQAFHYLARDSQRRSTRRQLSKVLAGRPIDFLMIDGDHWYEGVRRDWELYSPLVAKGGMVAFHDIVPHRAATGCEVNLVWQEVREGRDHLEIVHDPEEDRGWGPWGGIGVILK